MSLFIAWVLFPLVLGLLSLGAGMVVVRASDVRVPGVLVLPLGLALIVVVSQIATYWDLTAELATPLVVAIALLGLLTCVPRLRGVRVDRWALGAAAGVFAVFAAPVALSGEATFAGYTLLGDTSIHFALIDRVMEHGRNVSGLAPSSYSSALKGYFDTAYPLGGHTALGAVRPLVAQDVAWVFQPYLAFIVALTSLCLYALTQPIIPSRPLRALVAFVAAQPALVLAYALQGSIKEVASAWILVLLCAVVPLAVAKGQGMRRLIPLAVTSAGAIGILSLAVAPWLGPLLLVSLAAIARQRGLRERTVTLREAGAFAAFTAALSLPTLLLSDTFVRTTKAVVTAPNEFGNLLGPLHRLQLFGIWPSGDFRVSPGPGDLEATYVLIGVAAVAALLGTLWAIRARGGAVLLYVAVSLIGWAYATRRGSPWVDAKALMIASPAVLLAAMLGPVALMSSGRRLEGVLLASAIAFGVLWSNALAYHDVDLAPRPRLLELQKTGARIDGQGPTLYTEFEEFGKHFLRGADPTGWSEAWQPLPERGRFGFSADIDQVPIRDVLRFRTLVLRRSPSASRPPAPYRRILAGKHYEVWQRPEGRAGAVAAHLPLGDALQASSRPNCGAVRALAAKARRSHRRLAYVERPLSELFEPAKARLPAGWQPDAQDPLSLRTPGPGRLQGSIRIPREGSYEVWVQGSFGRSVAVRLDGRRVGAVSYQLNGRGQYAYLGEASVGRGIHSVALSRGGGDLHPGNGGRNRLLGPVALSPMGAEGRAVAYARPQQVARLCTKNLDWVEAVAGLP